MLLEQAHGDASRQAATAAADGQVNALCFEIGVAVLHDELDPQRRIAAFKRLQARHQPQTAD